jgi:hypothetical protein
LKYEVIHTHITTFLATPARRGRVPASSST